MSGWVKFHRKIEDWEWYKDANTFRVFFHLVLKANHKDGKWQGVDIKRGQIVTSPDSIAKELKLTRQQVRTSLNKLKSTNELTIKSTNKYSLVTVENYGLYQSKEEEITNKTPSEQQTDNQQITTNKNDKKKKEEKKEEVTELVERILEIHKSLLNLPQAAKVTDKRTKAIKARLNDYTFDEVVKVLETANQSDFLIKSKSTGWYNFDWIYNPNNFVKIYEGNYSSKSTQQQSAQSEFEQMYGGLMRKGE